MSSAGTAMRRPSRSTVARGSIMPRIASSACSARPSWTIADDGVDQDHGEDDGGIDDMADRSGEHGSAEQARRSGDCGTAQEAEDLASLGAPSASRFGPTALLPRLGLVRGKPFHPGLQRRESLCDRLCMPCNPGDTLRLPCSRVQGSLSSRWGLLSVSRRSSVDANQSAVHGRAMRVAPRVAFCFIGGRILG